MTVVKHHLSIILSLLISLFWSVPSFALNSFSYSGQLIGDKGMPHDGATNLVFILYQNTTEKCRQRIDGVTLNQGFFSVNLGFPHTNATYRCQISGTTTTLTRVMSEAIENDHDLFIEIEDLTHGKTFRQQLITALPQSFVANQLPQKGASEHDLLWWEDASGQWRAGGPSGVAIDDTNCQEHDLLIYDGSKFGCQQIDSTVVNDDSINTDDIEDGAVTGEKFADGAIETINLVDGAVTGDKIQDGSITSNAILDGSVNTNQIQDGAITNSKIFDETLETDKFAPNSITAPKIPDNALETNVIAPSTIDTTNIADGNITGIKILDGAITNPKIAIGIGAEKIRDETITHTKINNQAITAAKIPFNNISRDKIAPNTLQNAKFNDDAITTDKIVDGSIISDVIEDGAVTTAKLANQSITNTKISGITANCPADNIMVADGNGSFYCQRNIWGGTPAMMMWHNTASIPSGWQICTTANLNGRYIKGAANDGELNTTGGSATHTHEWESDLSHSHEWSYTSDENHNHSYSDTHDHTHSYPHTHSKDIVAYSKTFNDQTSGGNFRNDSSPAAPNKWGHHHGNTTVSTTSGSGSYDMNDASISTIVGTNATMSEENPSWSTTSSSPSILASGTSTATISDPPFTEIVYICYTGP